VDEYTSARIELRYDESDGSGQTHLYEMDFYGIINPDKALFIRRGTIVRKLGVLGPTLYIPLQTHDALLTFRRFRSRSRRTAFILPFSTRIRRTFRLSL
jgi:hypothetical protein